MAVRKVVVEGDEILRKKSKPVVDFDERLHILLDDMAETMKKYEGAGLAAVQVGILKRVFVMDTGNGLRECINPIILKEEGVNKVKVEGCLSVPERYEEVERPMTVTVRAQDRHGNNIVVTGEGLKARAFCHEIDHLDGVLFIDRTK